MKKETDMNAILNAIKSMDDTIVRETLAYLLKVYVIDRGLSHEGVIPAQTTSIHPGKEPGSFVELMRDLKKRYAHTIEELTCFSIDDKNVYVSIEGNTYTLTNTNSKTQTTIVADSNTSNTIREKKHDTNTTSSSGRFEKLEMD